MYGLKRLKELLGRRPIKLCLTFSLLILLLSWIELAEFYRIIATADYSYLGYALIIIIFNRLLMPIKWGLLLRGIGIQAPWWLTVKSYFISSFMGIFLPPTIGADAVRAYYVSKLDYKLTDIIASIFVERTIGLIVLLLFSGIGCLLITQHLQVYEFNLNTILILCTCLLALLIAGLVISLNKTVEHLILSILRRPRQTLLTAKINCSLEKFYMAYVKFSDTKGTIMLFGLLTCLETTLPIIRSYIVGLAVGVNLPISYYFAFQPIVILLTRLPISIDGFGINEGLFAYFLGLMGVSLTLGFTVGLVNHILFLLVISIGGIIYALDGQAATTPKTSNS